MVIAKPLFNLKMGWCGITLTVLQLKERLDHVFALDSYVRSHKKRCVGNRHILLSWVKSCLFALHVFNEFLDVVEFMRSGLILACHVDEFAPRAVGTGLGGLTNALEEEQLHPNFVDAFAQVVVGGQIHSIPEYCKAFCDELVRIEGMLVVDKDAVVHFMRMLYQKEWMY